MKMEASRFGDQELGAILDGRELQPPLMNCPSGRRVTEMCLDVRCASYLTCGSEECRPCSQRHFRCDPGVRKINRITGRLNDMVSIKTKMAQKIAIIDNDHSRQINDSLVEFTKASSFRSLNRDAQAILEKFYN